VLGTAFGCSSTSPKNRAADRLPPGEASTPYAEDDAIHLNQIQVKATHNSYHLETPGTVIPEWRYSRDPLPMQLEQEGVRGVELDTHFDPATGDVSVFHIGGGDERSTCRAFVECLGLLKQWSDAHPLHEPLFVQIEPKEPSLNQTVDFPAYADAVDREILSVWPRDRLITPADVQGDAPTLRDAVTKRGWPTLRAARGKVLFYENQRTTFHAAYTRGGSDISGRVLFPESHPDEPIAGIVILNTPDLATADVVRQGFIVRTMCDGVPWTPDMDGRRATALESGAQIVSTDYPVPVATDGGVLTAFDVPGGTPSRCDPVNAPAGCTSLAIENPADLGAAAH
jgi:hypothetical protein